MVQSLLIINIAGLSRSAIGTNTPCLDGLANRGMGPIALQPPVPALTSTSQATLLTGSLPEQHGIVANGWYFRELAQVLNWQRSARLLSGETIWEAAKQVAPSMECANLFWRYATHSTCDVKVTERPTYWADGRKSPDVYAEPARVRHELVERFGPFPLFRFWGPAADITSTRWIVDATLHLIGQGNFGLVFTYLPHLDYDHQRYGPHSTQGAAALRALDAEAGRLIAGATEHGMHVAVVSDYAFEPVSKPIFLNRTLREAGLVSVQAAENGELLEPGASAAFAVCDQQIALVYVHDPSVAPRVEKLLRNTDGVEQVLDRQAMKEQGAYHSRSGELLAIAEQGCWFAYPYWLDDSHAPDFAHCVAIHDKPGFDPSELFLATGIYGKAHLAKRLIQKQLGLRAPFDVIAGDASLVRGSHGRVPANDDTRPVLLASWAVDSPELLPMQQVKSRLLARLFD